MPSFSVPSFKMPSFSMPGFNQPGMPVHVSSVPPGAEASFGNGGESCRTPCTLAAPNGTGTYNVSFTLEGYEPHSIPVRVAVNEFRLAAIGRRRNDADHSDLAQPGLC